MAKKKTNKVIEAVEETVTPVVETTVEETVAEAPVEEQPLTLEQVKALEEATRAAFKALFSKKQ